MVLTNLFTWLSLNLKFITINGLSHLIAGSLLATVIYPFLSGVYQKRLNYSLFVFFPAVFGSIFPDLLFIISTLIRKKSLNGWIYLLNNGGSIHSAFHRDIAFILVIPTVVFMIILAVYFINWVGKRFNYKLTLNDLPSKWLLISGAISLLGAVGHLFMDMVGF